MVIFLDSECLKNEVLNVLGDRKTMSNNGWIISVSDDKQSTTLNLEQCEGDKNWYGWEDGTNVGTLSVYLKGCGELELDYGNCGGTIGSGIVEVYLDTSFQSLAKVNTNSKVVKRLYFKPGQRLLLREDYGIIRLNSITFKCTGKMYIII